MRYTVVCGYVSVEEEPDMEFPILRDKRNDEITAGQVRAVFAYRTTTCISRAARTRIEIGERNPHREYA